MGEEGHTHSHEGGALSWRGACAQGGGHARGEARTLMGRVCSWGARTGAEECEAGHVTDAALMGEGCAHGETQTEAEERKARRKVEEETPSQPVVKTNLSDARQRLQIRRAPAPLGTILFSYHGNLVF